MSFKIHVTFSFGPEKKKNKREMAYPERRFPPLEGMDPAILTCPLAIGATGKATEPGISDAISVRQRQGKRWGKSLIHYLQGEISADNIRDRPFPKQTEKAFLFISKE